MLDHEIPGVGDPVMDPVQTLDGPQDPANLQQ